MTKVLTPLFVHQEGADPSLGKQTHQVMQFNEELGLVELRNIHTQLSFNVVNKSSDFRVDTLVSDVQLVQRPNDAAWEDNHEKAVDTLLRLTNQYQTVG